jgi:cyclopropane fatty-acyl-phospholipid synthase-like methyltransferase
MKSVEESVVIAMDGSDKDLFPFLSYILQDLWEIGAYPDAIIKLIRKYYDNYTNLKVLDLGCGKGAVSVKVSQKLGCTCYGIDAIPEFISYAQRKAIEYDVELLCKFEIGDVRLKIYELKAYDIIILGAKGPVFGNYFTTLSTLSKHLNDSGLIIINDGYIEDNSDYTHPLMLKKQDLLNQISLAGMKLIEDEILTSNSIKDSDDYILDNLKKRCMELIDKHPDKKNLFENYIKKQQEENDALENKVVCTSWVIKKDERNSSLHHNTV